MASPQRISLANGKGPNISAGPKSLNMPLVPRCVTEFLFCDEIRYQMFILFTTGKSLLWVAVLGFVIFYLYALISFALLRTSFDPESELYCATLWQCTVTVIRYGLIGDLFEVCFQHYALLRYVTFRVYNPDIIR